MISQDRLGAELRKRILSLDGVTERKTAGIHEDAFYVDGKMFMHIHGAVHCDIRLPKDVQARVLAEGKARPHRYAPEAGYVTFVVRDEKDLEGVLELIRASYEYLARQPQAAS